MISILKSYKTEIITCVAMTEAQNMLWIGPVVSAAHFPDFTKIILISQEMSEISADK